IPDGRFAVVRWGQPSVEDLLLLRITGLVVDFPVVVRFHQRVAFVELNHGILQCAGHSVRGERWPNAAHQNSCPLRTDDDKAGNRTLISGKHSRTCREVKQPRWRRDWFSVEEV